MNRTSTPPLPPTRIQVVTRSIRRNLGRLPEILLNNIFAIDQRAATRRTFSLILLLLLSGVLLSFRSHPPEAWTSTLGRLFQAIFQGGAVGTAIGDFISLVWRALSDPQTVRFLPVILIPFLLGWHLAARYLADIFELESVNTAREFIWNVSFSSFYPVIRISKGQVQEKDKNSPVLKIGGPGRVIVDLDSAALFELPDGRPHVIGPTADVPWRAAALSGFERLRAVYDLRDHTTDPLTVSDLSQDGMRVEARDVRMVFSVWRGEKPEERESTLQRPYPFSPQAIETLTYNELRILRDPSVEKKADVSTPWPPPWTNSVTALIRRELGDFIQRHPLGEFLAYTGRPEPWFPPRPFAPRPAVSNLFNDFAGKFTQTARQRGVEVRWVGVGTWHTPPEILPERHLEAWRLTYESQLMDTDASRARRAREVRAEELLRLIREMPIAAYERLQAADLPAQQAMLDLLREYMARLRHASDALRLDACDRVIDFVEQVVIDNLRRHGPTP